MVCGVEWEERRGEEKAAKRQTVLDEGGLELRKRAECLEAL